MGKKTTWMITNQNNTELVAARETFSCSITSTSPTMGKSAKLHKRTVRLLFAYTVLLLITFYQHKKDKSTGASGSASASVTASTTTSAQVQAAKKRATLKNKTTKMHGSSSAKDGVLGGADYVALMMGSRRKAQQEAQKLPQNNNPA